MSKLEIYDNHNDRQQSRGSSGSSAKSGPNMRDVDDRLKKVNELETFIRNEDEKLNYEYGYGRGGGGGDDMDEITRDELQEEDDGDSHFYGNYNDFSFTDYRDPGNQRVQDEDGEEYDSNLPNLPNRKNADNLSTKQVVDENLVLEDFDSSNNLNGINGKNVITSEKQIKDDDQTSVRSGGMVTSVVSSVRNLFGTKKVDSIEKQSLGKRGPVRMNAFEESQEKPSSFCCF